MVLRRCCGAAALLLATSARAAELNAQELDAAIQSGDFTAFNTAITASLAKKVPADAKQISEAAMQPLLTDPTFVGGLSQRQFVAKVEAAELGAFAKAAPDNRKFLTWLLHNTEAMDGCLLAATPTGAGADAATAPGTSGVGSAATWTADCVRRHQVRSRSRCSKARSALWTPCGPAALLT